MKPFSDDLSPCTAGGLVKLDTDGLHDWAENIVQRSPAALAGSTFVDAITANGEMFHMIPFFNWADRPERIEQCDAFAEEAAKVFRERAVIRYVICMETPAISIWPPGMPIHAHFGSSIQEIEGIAVFAMDETGYFQSTFHEFARDPATAAITGITRPNGLVATPAFFKTFFRH